MSAIPIKTVQSDADGNLHFRFIPLKERLKRIQMRPSSIRASTFLGGDIEDCSWTFFAESISKLRELDLTEDFTNFSREVSQLSISLPVLYLNHKEIINTIFKYMKKKNTPAASSFCDLLSAIARDLGKEEFWPFWKDAVYSLYVMVSGGISDLQHAQDERDEDEDENNDDNDHDDNNYDKNNHDDDDSLDSDEDNVNADVASLDGDRDNSDADINGHEDGNHDAEAPEVSYSDKVRKRKSHSAYVRKSKSKRKSLHRKMNGKNGKISENLDHAWDTSSVLKPVFECLGTLTKLLTLKILQNPKTAINAMEPILIHSKQRVQELAAESAGGYIIRRCRTEEALESMLLAFCSLSESAINGAGHAIFESVRGSNHSLSINYEPIVDKCLELYCKADGNDMIFHVLGNAWAKIATHTFHNVKSYTAILNKIFDKFKEVLNAKGASQIDELALKNCVYLLRCWLLQSRFTKVDAETAQNIVSMIQACLSSARISNVTAIELIFVAKRLFVNKVTLHSHKNIALFKKIFSTIRTTDISDHCKMWFLYQNYEADAMKKVVIEYAVDLISRSNNLTESFLMMKILLQFCKENQCERINVSKEITPLRNVLKNYMKMETVSKEVKFTLLEISIWGKFEDKELSDLIDNIANFARKSNDFNLATLAYKAELVSGNSAGITNNIFYEIANEDPGCVDAIKMLDANNQNRESSEELIRKFSPNLSSENASLRQATLDFLIQLEIDPKCRSLFELCQIVESQGGSFEKVDSSRLQIQKITSQISHLEPSTDIDKNILTAICNYAVGIFQIGLSYLWAEASELYHICEQKDVDISWNIMYSTLEKSLAEAIKCSKLKALDVEQSSDPKKVFALVSEALEIDISKNWNFQSFSSYEERYRDLHSRNLYTGTTNGEYPKGWNDKTETQMRPEIQFQRQIAFHTRLISALIDNPNLPRDKVRSLCENLYLRLYAHEKLLPVKDFDKMLSSYISLLRKFKGLRVFASLKETPQLVSLKKRLNDSFFDILGRSNANLQISALKCILLTERKIRDYQEVFVNLADDKTFRDQLSILTNTFSDIRKELTEYDDLGQFVRIISCILYGKMRKMKSSPTRRTECLSFICSQLNSNELSYVVDLFLRVFRKEYPKLFEEENLCKLWILDKTEFISQARESCCDFDKLETRSLSRIVNSLYDALTMLGKDLDDISLQKIMLVAILCLHRANSKLNQQDSSRFEKELRSICLKLICVPIEKQLSEKITQKAVEIAADCCQTLSQHLDPKSRSPPAIIKFMATVSSSHAFQHVLFLQDQTLMNIFVLFRHESISSTFTNAICDIVEHYITFTGELGAQSSRIQKEPSTLVLEYLACSLESKVLQIVDNSKSNLGPELVNRILDIVTRFTKLGLCLGSLWKLFDPVASFIFKNSRSSWYKLESILHCLCEILSLCPDKNIALNALPHISSLFAEDQFQSHQEILCDIIITYGGDWSLFVAENLKKAMKLSDTRMDEPDYESRLEAYRNFEDFFIGENKHWNVTTRGVLFSLPIIFHCINAAQSEDKVLKGSSGHVLATSVHFCVTLVESDRISHVNHLKLIVESLKNTLFHLDKDLDQKSEIMKVLGIFIRRIPSDIIPIVDILKPLTRADDLEADFFENILHIQKHRRVRAMRRLVNFFSENHESFGEEKYAILSSSFAYPLLSQVLLNSAVPISDEMTETCIACCRVSAFKMKWRTWKTAFLDLKGKILRSEENANMKIFVKILIALVKGLNTERLIIENNNLHETFLVDKALPTMLILISKPLNRAQRQDNQFPFHPSIALCTCELMSKIPLEKKNMFIPTFVAKTCVGLKARLQSTRDESRKVLNHFLILHGPQYLKFTISELRASLSEGFRRHVCVYTIGTLLKAIKEHCESKSTRFPIDDAVVDILMVVYDDIFESSKIDSKEYESKAKILESSKKGRREIIQDVSQLLDFSSSAESIITFIKAKLEENFHAKLKTKFRDFLNYIIMGLGSNTTVDFEYGLKISHDILQDACDILNNENETSYAILKQSILAEFSFKLFLLVTKKMDLEDPKSYGYMDPFLSFVNWTLTTQYDFLTQMSLTVAQKLIKLSLKKKQECIQNCFMTVTQILARPSMGDNELFMKCLRMAAVLINETDTVSEEKIKTIIQISRSILTQGNQDSQNVAMAVAKAALGKKLVTPILYDFIDDVSIIAISSHSPSLRSSAISVLMSFILNYPMTNKRVRQHLDFIVKNLSYIFVDGRLAAIDSIHQIVTRFPQVKVEEESEYLFVSLARLLANDHEPRCKRQASDVMRMIAEKVSGRKLLALVLICEQWLKSDQPLTRVGAIASIPLVLSKKLGDSSFKSLFQSLVSSVLKSPVTTNVIDYLKTVEVFLNECPSMALNSTSEALWNELYSNRIYLCNPAPDIQYMASKLFGYHFAAIGKPENVQHEQYACLNQKGVSRIIMKILFQQLQNNEKKSELSEQAIKNLLFISTAVLYFPELGNITSQAGPTITSSDDEIQSNENRGVKWFLNRIRGIIVKEGSKCTLCQASCMRLLVAVATTWKFESIKPYLKSGVIPSVYHVLNNTDEKVENEEYKEALKIMGEELQQTLLEKLGSNQYHEEVNKYREKLAKKSIERKRKRALEAVLDPETAAKNKIEHNLRRKRKRKEKALIHAKRRGSHRVTRGSISVLDHGSD